MEFHLSVAALTTLGWPANGVELYGIPLEKFHLNVVALVTLGRPANGVGLYEIP